MTTYCNFHISHTYDGVQNVFFPYCGCGWTGEIAKSDELTQADLTGVAYRWERHRVQFLSKQRSMRSLVP